MNNHPFRILGIDTSLRSTGVGVVEASGDKLSVVEYGTLKIPAKKHVSECLRLLYNNITEIIERTTPNAVAIEGVFFSKNAKTALILGEARGTVISVCACHNLPIYEYAPRKVKQAIAGFGNAEKQQIQKMVMSLLTLEKEPQEDAGDALAIAICHLHNRTGYIALKPKEI